MSEKQNNKNEDLSEYISNMKNQEIKVLLLKLKNEINKPDAGWEDIKSILIKLKERTLTCLKRLCLYY